MNIARLHLHKQLPGFVFLLNEKNLVQQIFLTYFKLESEILIGPFRRSHDALGNYSMQIFSVDDVSDRAKVFYSVIKYP